MSFMKLKTVVALAVIVGAVHASAAQEMRLLMTSMSPAQSPNSALFNAWAQRVNEQSKGTLKIEVRDGTTLAHFGNVYGRVLDDVVQIGWSTQQVQAGLFPLSAVGGLPFITDDVGVSSAAFWRLFKAGLLDAEFKDIVPLWMAVYPPAQLHFAKQPRSIDDLRGLKIGTAGRVQSQLVERLGGTPISIQTSEFYEALQRGTVDGVMCAWSAFAPYKLQEVTSYHVEGPLGPLTGVFFMSKAKYNTLPVAARQALEANSGEAQSRSFGLYLNSQGAIQRNLVSTSNKHAIVQLSPQQYAEWEKKSASPIVTDWVKSVSGGDKVLDAYRRFYADVKAGR